MNQFIPSKSDDKDSDKYSTASSTKSKNMKAYVGFEVEELKKTSTSDLKQLKITILTYLKSTSQKYKNSEYYGLFKRLIEELKSRCALSKEELISLNKKREKKTQEDNDKTFLGKKKNFKESIFDINIPSFLNDKQIHKSKEPKKEIKEIKKYKKFLDTSDEESESFHIKRNIFEKINKNCIIKGNFSLLKL